MKRDTENPTKKALEAARVYRENGPETDPLGSYTGVPREIKDLAADIFPPRDPYREPKEFPPASVQSAVKGGKVYRRTEQSPAPDIPVQDVDDI